MILIQYSNNYSNDLDFYSIKNWEIKLNTDRDFIYLDILDWMEPYYIECDQKSPMIWLVSSMHKIKESNNLYGLH